MEGGTEQPAATPAEQKRDDISLAQFKKYLPYIVLAALLVLGFNLRAYHLDYPVVGYHNWKEVHYLTEARNFAENGIVFKPWPFVPQWDLPFLKEPVTGEHADTFPTISILGSFAYRLFGDNLGALRGIGVILNLASIVLLYFIVRRLFKREDLALATAAVAALNPLMIFFSRNFQLDSPALFFMLLGTWFFLKWIEHDKPRDFILTAAFVTFGIMTKYSFVVMAFPFLVIFPYKRLLEWKSRLKTFIPAAGIGLALLLWFTYMELIFKGWVKSVYGVTGGAVISLTEIISFTEIFTAGFWQVMWPFIADNFTIAGFWFAVLGAFLLVMMRHKHPLGARYFLAYAGFGVLFTIILAHKLGGHSYHQFPYAPLAVFLIAYAFVVISTTAASLVRFTHARWLLISLLILVLWPATNASLDRQFGLVFPGLDVAGQFINMNSQPGEKIFHSSHQNYGVLWHADRAGYKLPDDIVSFVEGEEKGVRWLFIYQWRLNFFQNEDVMPYVRENYHLRQVGFAMQGTDFVPYYFLLEKGGTFDENKINELLSGRGLGTRTYELPQGEFTLNVITLPHQSSEDTARQQRAQQELEALLNETQ